MATNNLESARDKIALAGCLFQDLPAHASSSLWTGILQHYNLTLAEASALQNARCVPPASNLFWFIFTSTSILILSYFFNLILQLLLLCQVERCCLLIYFPLPSKIVTLTPAENPSVSVQDYMKSVSEKLHHYAPSSFGTEFYKFADRASSAPLQFHRDPRRIWSFPTSLALGCIGEYHDNVKSIELEEDDYLQTKRFCQEMMGCYHKENERRDQTNDIFLQYFELPCSPYSFTGASGNHLCTDGTINLCLGNSACNVMIFNRKVKTELGKTGSSAPEECFWSHYQHLITQTNPLLLERFCCPAILCSIVGPYISFSVGLQLRKLTESHYVCDPVTPFLPLMLLPHQPEFMTAVARALKATKKCIHDLARNYRKKDQPNAVGDQLGYPWFDTFEVGGYRYKFKYERNLVSANNSHHLIYLVGITEVTPRENTSELELPVLSPGQKLVVKFTRRFGTDVHQWLQDNELAPVLYCDYALPGGWTMIAMEYSDWTPIHSLDHRRIPVETKINTVRSVKKALDVLKMKNMVHGDLRMNNILLANNGSAVKIIDFEFSGCTAGPTPARYPPFLNKSGEIEWAPGVRCDGPLATEHDHFLYLKIFPEVEHP
jgi:hypothetical protein